MANITETTPATYTAGIYQIEDGDPATGGPGGITVLPAKQLADRTKWLKEQVDAILAELGLSASLGPEMPIAALPYPTCAAADNRLAVGAGSGTNGGNVTIAEGQRLTLGMEVEAGETARLGAWVTEEWESADLAVSTTYYLRAQITDGALVLYTTKGADNDAIPAGLKGTPNAGSGGGFDSTRIDCLLAKVVTGLAGTVPEVTELANAPTLRLVAHVFDDAIERAMDWTAWPLAAVTLDWARTPVAALTMSMVGATSSLPSGADVPTGEILQLCGVRTVTVSRTALAAEYVYDDYANNNGSVAATWVAHA